MPLPIVRPLNSKYLNAYMADIGAASSAFIAVPARGEVRAVYIVVSAQLTGADAVLTVKKNGASVGQTITVPFTGSAAGTVVAAALTPIDVVDGDNIELASDGGPTNAGAVPAWITVAIRE